MDISQAVQAGILQKMDFAREYFMNALRIKTDLFEVLIVEYDSKQGLIPS